MFGRDARRAHQLCSCQTCGSRAVSAMANHELGESRVLLRIRCGECGAWRVAHLHWWRAQTVEARIGRRRRRDRRQIASDLRRLGTVGVEPEDFGLPELNPSLFR